MNHTTPLTHAYLDYRAIETLDHDTAATIIATDDRLSDTAFLLLLRAATTKTPRELTPMRILADQYATTPQTLEAAIHELADSPYASLTDIGCLRFERIPETHEWC